MNMVPIYTEGPSSRASKPLIKGDDTRSRDRATSMGRDEPLSQLWGRKCIYQSQAVADTPIHRVLRHKRGTCGGKSLVSVRSRGFPGGSVVKNLPANAGDTGILGSIHGLARLSGGGNGTPLQYSCQDAHGQRGLGSYSPWGHRAGHA